MDTSNVTRLHNNVGSRKVDASKGEMRSEVSSQWFNRPDDQRFLNLDTLYNFVRQSADDSISGIIETSDIQVKASADSPTKLDLVFPLRGEERITQPSNWSFGQLCSLVKAPSHYLRSLPASLAGINLQYGISNYRPERVQAYVTNRADDEVELRATTGQDYGRIYDHEVVASVQKLAGNGIGDTNWKIPGVMNWHDGSYDPDTLVTSQSTTLFASDRDIFLFLVDDRNPIEVGLLSDGSPDLMFRGFYVWNSEVGSRSLGIACFYLRGVCQNRCLWGVEGFEEIKLRHSKNAPQRFMHVAAPALQQFTNGSTKALIQGVEEAKKAKVARNDDDAIEFLRKQKFSKPDTTAIINSVMETEGHKPRSVWDFVQGITSMAKEKGHQDSRLSMERQAGILLNKVA